MDGRRLDGYTIRSPCESNDSCELKTYTPTRLNHISPVYHIKTTFFFSTWSIISVYLMPLGDILINATKSGLYISLSTCNQARCKSGLRYTTSFEVVNLVLGLKMCMLI